MGRRKKTADQPESVTEQQPLDGENIRSTHDDLINTVEDLRAKAAFFSNEDGGFKSALISQFDDEINTSLCGLENIEKSALEREQGRIAGMRWARQVVMGTAFEDDLAQAEKSLAEFEEQNALLLQ